MQRALLYIGNKLSNFGYTPGIIDTLGPQLEKAGYDVYYAGNKVIPILRLAQMVKVTFRLRNEVNYVLIDTYSTSAFWYAFTISFICWSLKLKYIPILHGGALPLRLRKSKQFSWFIFTKSFANIAVSKYLASTFLMEGYKSIVIPNNIDITCYPFHLRRKPRPRILWVRSFHRQYNPIMAANVIYELIKYYADVELCMVGPDKDGSLKEFRNYIKVLGVENHVTITGLLIKEEWIELSREYDFFINTTNVDNTPVSVIEALGLGLAVISTNPGGIPYLLTSGQNSILVNCNDHKEMAYQISRLVNSPDEYKQLSLKGRELAESFDWSVIKTLWTDLLK